MHRLGVLHLDHSPGNTLVRKTADGYQFTIVDINRMQFRSVDTDQGLQNMDRLSDEPSLIRTIAHTYADCAGANPEECEQKLVHYVQRRKKLMARKRFLKRLVVR